MSEFSHAAPLNIEKITPAQWTIEVSIKAKFIRDIPQTFVGRDDVSPFAGEQANPPFSRLAFQVNAKNRFAIRFYDIDNRRHEAVAQGLPVEAGRWYNLAATSDGQPCGSMSMRATETATDFRPRRPCRIPVHTALGCGANDPEWSIGRGRDDETGRPAEFFQGWIDEVRISDVARHPSGFLFAKRPEKAQETKDERY